MNKENKTHTEEDYKKAIKTLKKKYLNLKEEQNSLV